MTLMFRWMLRAGNAGFSTKATMLEEQLPAGGYFIVGEADVSSNGVDAT